MLHTHLNIVKNILPNEKVHKDERVQVSEEEDVIVVR